MTDFPVNEYTEQWRPQLHFTPAKNWLNDPNGLVYYDGVYHLFFQYNPDGNDWGNMSWGHATSYDLVNWEEHDVALQAEPNGLGYIFSGSIVIDWHNTSGLQSEGHPPLVALFTHHSAEGRQTQSVAYSVDGGDNWSKYNNNPVIENPGLKDFRDPKVFWHKESQQWVMVLACGQFVQLYGSKNLLEWSFISDFGSENGIHTGEWECPDLFALTTKQGKTRWVMLVSLNPGGPNGGSATQYFIGDFDGVRFLPEHNDIRWLDFGPDSYANVTWDGLQNFGNRRICVGWMSNWNYAGDIPTFPWRGAMTIPRELELVEKGSECFVFSLPTKEITEGRKLLNQKFSTDEISFELPGRTALLIDFEADINLQDKLVIVFKNDLHEELKIIYRPKLKKITIDRRNAGWDCKFWTMSLLEAYLLEFCTDVKGQILLDASSLELFWDQGATCMTANLYPKEPFNQLTVTSTGIGNKMVSVSTLGES